MKIRILSLLLALCLCLSGLPGRVWAQEHHQMSAEELEVLRIVNRERGAQGLLPLTSMPILQSACNIRAEEISTVFAHSRPDDAPWHTILDEMGITGYRSAGENIAAGYSTPAATMNGWMNSSGHRANILGESFTHIGVGYYYSPNSSYGNYWTQIFYCDFDCAYTRMELLTPQGRIFPVGTPVEEMEILAKLTCQSCGDCYLPVLADYCTGLDVQNAGEQVLTVSCLGQTARVGITMGEESTEPEPTEPEPTEPEPTEPTENPFTDVPAGTYYHDPVLWAYQNNITTGLSVTTFAPDKNCTRAQVVTFLWRAAGSPEPTSTQNPFADVKEGSFYYKAVLWAVENGITTGINKTTFAPNKACTRGQVVTFMHRAAGAPQPESTNNPFADVEKGAFYYDAVLWAVENGITTGVKMNQFAPAKTCTRGQIVTFLYRGYAN